jgi:hypothetical protein
MSDTLAILILFAVTPVSVAPPVPLQDAAAPPVPPCAPEVPPPVVPEPPAAVSPVVSKS